ncbi:MAG: TetR/AcrR family transcriptional regulator [Oscillospiraceae bacterium]|nr:TetR/AcrR family transcriptional regulator [Oscillospiraceae bacterium]MDD3260482.1 helix-turn-helix domain containing protein [Oscillospiraceae bacterium]
MPNEEIREKNIEKVLAAANKCFLESGIEQTSLEKISQCCNITLRSVNRYFDSKVDLVLQTFGWIGRHIYQLDGERIESLKRSTDKGIEIVIEFLFSLEQVYLSKPQFFSLKGEFDIYIYRHGLERDEGYKRMRKYFDPVGILVHAYKNGYTDGSMRKFLPPKEEAQYCCNSFFCFLQQLSMSKDAANEESMKAAKRQIDSYIERVRELYQMT